MAEKKLKAIRFLGYFLVFLCAFLVILLFRCHFFESERNVKFLFPLGTLGFFCLAYEAWYEDKKMRDENRYNLVTFRKNVGISLFMGIMLLLFTVML